METLRVHVHTIRRFIRDTRAATSIEYALIAAGISVAIVASVNTLGDSVKGLYERIRDAVVG